MEKTKNESILSGHRMWPVRPGMSEKALIFNKPYPGIVGNLSGLKTYHWV
jgi:hypothetical protein